MNKVVFVSCAVMAATMAFGSPADSVIKIFTIHSSPNYVMPWLTQPVEESTGSGCVIKGKRILTNAHNIGDHAFVMVRKQSSPQKYPAKVQVVGRDCDLAILTVDDATFFDDLEPLEIMNDLPALHEKVTVLGYPLGGDTISFTEGVVSRIEMQTYSHSYENLLAMQISAAINPGNSGGPVLIDDKLSGIAFECMENAQNIAYAVPVPVIHHFLAGVERDGKYDGFGWLGIDCQPMENEYMRVYKQMKKNQSGMLIYDITDPLTIAQKIQQGDVLMAIDGVQIANDGTIPLRQNERVSWDYLISCKHPGEKQVLKILRDGKVMDVQLPVEAHTPLVPLLQYDINPSYFIHAGLVFIPLSLNYIMMIGGEKMADCPANLSLLLTSGEKQYLDEQVVVLSEVLLDEVNMGYEQIKSMRVLKVNGAPIRNLKDLVARVETNKEAYLIIEIENYGIVAIDAAKARESKDRILKQYRIPAEKSKDLM